MNKPPLKSGIRRIRPLPVSEPGPAIRSGPSKELKSIALPDTEPRSERFAGRSVQFAETARNFGVHLGGLGQVMVKHDSERPELHLVRPNKLLDLSRKDGQILGIMDGILDPDA